MSSSVLDVGVFDGNSLQIETGNDDASSNNNMPTVLPRTLNNNKQASSSMFGTFTSRASQSIRRGEAQHKSQHSMPAAITLSTRKSLSRGGAIYPVSRSKDVIARPRACIQRKITRNKYGRSKSREIAKAKVKADLESLGEKEDRSEVDEHCREDEKSAESRTSTGMDETQSQALTFSESGNTEMLAPVWTPEAQIALAIFNAELSEEDQTAEILKAASSLINAATLSQSEEELSDPDSVTVTSQMINDHIKLLEKGRLATISNKGHWSSVKSAGWVKRKRMRYFVSLGLVGGLLLPIYFQISVKTLLYSNKLFNLCGVMTLLLGSFALSVVALHIWTSFSHRVIWKCSMWMSYGASLCQVVTFILFATSVCGVGCSMGSSVWSAVLLSALIWLVLAFEMKVNTPPFNLTCHGDKEGGYEPPHIVDMLA